MQHACYMNTVDSTNDNVPHETMHIIDGYLPQSMNIYPIHRFIYAWYVIVVRSEVVPGMIIVHG